MTFNLVSVVLRYCLLLTQIMQNMRVLELNSRAVAFTEIQALAIDMDVTVRSQRLACCHPINVYSRRQDFVCFIQSS